MVQYRYISPKLMRIALRDGGACNTVIYLQLNWHGDFYRGYSADGGSFTVQQGDEWGNWPSGPLACGAQPAYRWNAQWGALFFADLGAPNGTNPPLGLYYVHGRWYNPEVGLFLSPNEKGDYFYGGDAQDAANYAWIATSENRPAPPPRTGPVSLGGGIWDRLCKVARALGLLDGGCGGRRQPPQAPVGGGPKGAGAGSTTTIEGETPAGRSFWDMIKNDNTFDRWMKHSKPVENPLSVDEAQAVWDKLQSQGYDPIFHPYGETVEYFTGPHINVQYGGSNIHIPVTSDFVPPP